jgi:hypothetical protein
MRGRWTDGDTRARTTECAPPCGGSPAPRLRGLSGRAVEVPEPVKADVLLDGHPTQALAGLLERDRAHGRDLGGGQRLAGPGRHLGDLGGVGAALGAGTEVGNRYLVRRQRLKAWRGEGRSVGALELVGRAGVAVTTVAVVGQRVDERQGCRAGVRLAFRS